MLTPSKVVYLIRVFYLETLCSQLSAEHFVLLFHTGIRWLSKGNMFNHLYELKTEVEIIVLQLGKEIYGVAPGRGRICRYLRTPLLYGTPRIGFFLVPHK